MLIKSKSIIIIICLSVCLSIAYTVFLFSQEMKQTELPVLGQVADFSLFDEQGRRFSLKDLEGKIWTANFFFTTCGDICPIMTKNMAALQRSFNIIEDINHVSITVNPEFDTSDRLKKYAQKFKANHSKWHFLTGTRKQIREVVLKSFKLGSIEEPVFHSPKFALIDRQGFIRGYYDGVQAGEVSQLFKDMSLLLREK